MRRIAVLGFIFLSALAAFFAYTHLVTLDTHKSAAPTNPASVSSIVQNLILSAQRKRSIAELDLDLSRMMPDDDDRTAQLFGAISSLAAQELPHIGDVFDALRDSDTLSGEAVLSDLYEQEKERLEIDQLALAQAGQNLAALTALRDTDAALNIYSETASLGADLALSWAHLGHISQREGREDLAVRAYDMALFLSGPSEEEGENKAATMAARTGLALIALRTGDMFDTEANGRAALAIAEELDDKAYLAVISSITGRILVLQRQLEQAELFQLHALELEEELGRTSGLAMVNEDLGMLARMRGDHEASANFHRTALAHFETLNHTSGIARQTAELGSDLKALGDTQAACAQWQRALPLFRQVLNTSRTEQMQAVININDC